MLIEKAFKLRISLQYYTNKSIKNNETEKIIKSVSSFIIKNKNNLKEININEINKIRENLK